MEDRLFRSLGTGTGAPLFGRGREGEKSVQMFRVAHMCRKGKLARAFFDFMPSIR